MFSAQVNALLELVRSSSESSSEATALFYDELANLVMTSGLDPQVQVGPLCLAHCFFLFSGLWSSSWTHKHETSSVQQGIISNSVIDDFQKDFVVDVSPEIKALVQREKHRSLLDLTFEFLCD